MFNTLPANPFPPSSEQMNKGDLETVLATKANNEIIAPLFDETSGIYSVGDLVVYDGVLYQFTSAHETAGAWDISEVSAVKVSDELATLKSGLADVSGNNVVLNIAPNTYSTYADAMEALYTAYNALSDGAKTRSYIVYANLYIYHMNDAYNAQYTRVDSKIGTNDYKLVSQVFNCREKKLLAFTISSAGAVTSDDYSSSAQSQGIKLCY